MIPGFVCTVPKGESLVELEVGVVRMMHSTRNAQCGVYGFLERPTWAAVKESRRLVRSSSFGR